MPTEKRTVLFGGGGQLATALAAVLPGVIPVTRDEADLRDAEAVRRLLDATDPECVINTAAYNLVDRAETEPDAAFAVNALAPRTIAEWCGRNDRILVHISTDFVFGLETSRRTPYSELDCPGPVSAYGASKLAGEYFVRAACHRHFVVRTCGLYGMARRPGKRNFVETMLKLADERSELTVVDDQRCTPTSVRDLAEAVSALLQTSAWGLYHATNSGEVSWYEFACEIFRQAGREVLVRPVRSAEFNAPARRPDWSVLDCERLTSLIGRPLRPWPEALADYLRHRQSPPPAGEHRE